MILIYLFPNRLVFVIFHFYGLFIILAIVKSGTKTPTKKKRERIVMNGFVYHTSVVRYNPPVRYLVCAKYLTAGCHGRAVLPINAELKQLRVTQEHNHPPDNTVEERYAFMNKLKFAVQNAPDTSLKKVFCGIIDLHPNLLNEYTYESMRSSLRRWRKEITK